MSSKTPGNGWDRVEISLRLSRRRCDQLRKVAARLAPGATPTDAIDHALASALSAGREIDDRLTDLEDTLERRAMEQRFEIDRLEAAVRSLAEGVEALRALIAAVSQAEDI